MTGVDGIKRHVELEIDGKLLVGDVVLTDTIRAWYDSKLHLNSGLNRCILHVARRDVWTNLRMRLQSGKAIDTVLGSMLTRTGAGTVPDLLMDRRIPE